MKGRLTLFILTCSSVALSLASAQNSVDVIKVFLDCSCDRTYIREQIKEVNYVRDKESADLHIFSTHSGTGSGGRMNEIAFIGHGPFEGIDNTLLLEIASTDSSDEARKSWVKKLRLGLVSYLAHTGLADKISVDIETNGDELQTSVRDDPWNFWVFNIWADGDFEKESSKSFLSTRAGFSANRVTDQWKYRGNIQVYVNRQKFKQEDAEDILSKLNSNRVNASVVKSITDHWSMGVFTDFFTSTFSNVDLGYGIGPSFEYSIYPYEEFNRRELTLIYRLRYNYRDYDMITLYGKLQEQLYSQAVRMQLRITEPWGNVRASLEGSHFFHDIAANRLEFDARIDWRVFRGLSLNMSTGAEFIRDQLSLPAGEASLEEVLLSQRQLATDFQIYLSFGFTYRFGSIYNNVINPRL